MKVLLINPPSPPGTSVTRDSMGGFGSVTAGSQPGHPPMSLLYCGAVLDKAGVNARIIDCVQKPKGRIDFDAAKELVKEFDLIGILIALPSYLDDLRFVKAIKEEFPSKITVILGPTVSYFKEDAMRRSGSDFGILGEPEFAFLDLIKAICRRDGLGDVRGLLENKQGQVSLTRDNPKIKDLDSLPFPAWHLLNQKDKHFAVLASRGCPYECLYCPYSVIQGREVRYRSVESVVDEISYLKSSLGAQYFIMRDPIFTLNRNRVKQICALIQQKKIKINFSAETRPQHLDEEVLIELKKGGCNILNLGVESGDPRILVRAGRFRNLSQAEEALKRILIIRDKIKQLKISLIAFFVLGLPGENKDSVENTINYAKRLDAESTQFSLATPFPGTKLFEETLGKFKIPDDFARMNSFVTSSVGTEYLSPQDLESAKQRADFEMALKGLFKRPQYLISMFLKSGRKSSLCKRFIRGTWEFIKKHD